MRMRMTKTFTFFFSPLQISPAWTILDVGILERSTDARNIESAAVENHALAFPTAFSIKHNKN